MSNELPLATYYRWLEFKMPDGSTKGYTVFVQFPPLPQTGTTSETWRQRDLDVVLATRKLAEKHFREKNIEAEFIESYSLPYPASPYIGDSRGWPAFCFQPSQCKNRGACPRSYACSE